MVKGTSAIVMHYHVPLPFSDEFEMVCEPHFELYTTYHIQAVMNTSLAYGRLEVNACSLY